MDAITWSASRSINIAASIVFARGLMFLTAPA
jgi:hypothetical protein